MKLRYEFETIQVGDETSAVPVGDNSNEFHGILQLNAVGAKILKYLSESGSKEEVLLKLCSDYPEDDRNDIKNKLNIFLNQLIDEGFLIP